MSELLGVTVEDLVATAKQRKARIPSEIGAFVALEVCEAILTGPAVVRAADVRLAEDGTISVFAPPNSATSEEAARSVVALLAGLLVAAGTGVPRSLVALIEEGPASGRLVLESLRDDLEASLVPLNRSAARRVLSRMLRDVRRPRSVRPPPSEPAPPLPQDASLDAQLDDLLEGKLLEGKSPRGQKMPPAEPAPDALDAELDATLSELDMVAPAIEPRRAAEPRGAPEVELDDATLHEDAPAPRKVPSTAPTEPPPPAARKKDPPAKRVARLGEPALGDDLDAPRSSSPLGWIFAFLALIAATAAGLALLRPDLVDRALGRAPAPAPDPGVSPEERARVAREHRDRFGTLTVQVGQPRAQVLLFVGRGPAVARDLPIGVAHEFVAIAEGRRPTRAIVPADAQWEQDGDGRRYELAMQAGSEPMAELDLGPTGLPQDVGRPSGVLGSVRVITNPPGAKVYVVVGFSPSVTIENVRTDEAIELLVVPPGAPVVRVLVGPSDWDRDADGTRRASVSVER